MSDKKVVAQKVEIPKELTESITSIKREQDKITDTVLHLVDKTTFDNAMLKINDNLSNIITTLEALVSKSKTIEQAPTETKKKTKSLKSRIDTIVDKIDLAMPKLKTKPGVKKDEVTEGNQSLRLDINKNIYISLFLQAHYASKNWPSAIVSFMKAKAIDAFKNVGIDGYSEKDFTESFKVLNDTVLKEVEITDVEVLYNSLGDAKTCIKNRIEAAVKKTEFKKIKDAEQVKKLTEAYENFQRAVISTYLTKIDSDGKKIPPSTENKITMKFEESDLYRILNKQKPITEKDKQAYALKPKDEKVAENTNEVEDETENQQAELVEDDDADGF